MKRTVERINSPDLWQLGGETAELWTFSTSGETRFTYDGQFFLHGDGSPLSPYLKSPITISGAVVPYIEEFEIDSTDDSPDDPKGRYTSIIVAESGRRLMFLENYKVPSTLVDPAPILTWIEITLFTRARRRPFNDTYYTAADVDYRIAQAVGLLMRASESDLGIVQLSWPSSTPLSPVVISEGDPRVARDVGVATLVDGVASVFSGSVLNTSRIQLTSQDDGVSGALRAPIASRVENVSFEIVSFNDGDQGDVAWALYDA